MTGFEVIRPNPEAAHRFCTWDVTLVTDMSSLFHITYYMDKFNAPIDQWNTSQVTNMRCMFQGAKAFNQPIMMDTSKVTDMSSMFKDASSFNQPVTMDTSQVTQMEEMFAGATAMTYPIPSLNDTFLSPDRRSTIGELFQI